MSLFLVLSGNVPWPKGDISRSVAFTAPPPKKTPRPFFIGQFWAVDALFLLRWIRAMMSDDKQLFHEKWVRIYNSIRLSLFFHNMKR